jgi:hypothetical protein
MLTSSRLSSECREVLADHGQGKNIALVGHFQFIPKLRQAAGSQVIEQRPVEGEFLAEAAGDLIPRRMLLR